jgi:hypothetical protein
MESLSSRYPQACAPGIYFSKCSFEPTPIHHQLINKCMPPISEDFYTVSYGLEGLVHLLEDCLQLLARCTARFN